MGQGRCLSGEEVDRGGVRQGWHLGHTWKEAFSGARPVLL